jgi:hypothetical protein
LHVNRNVNFLCLSLAPQSLQGLELAALLEEHKERLTVHEEKATSLSRELETTSTTKSTEAAAQAALLKQSQQKVKSLETQVGFGNPGPNLL